MNVGIINNTTLTPLLVNKDYISLKTIVKQIVEHSILNKCVSDC